MKMGNPATKPYLSIQKKKDLQNYNKIFDVYNFTGAIAVIINLLLKKLMNSILKLRTFRAIIKVRQLFKRKKIY